MAGSPGLHSWCHGRHGFLQGKHLGCKARFLGGGSCLLLRGCGSGPQGSCAPLGTMAAPVPAQGSPASSQQLLTNTDFFCRRWTLLIKSAL